MTPNHIQYFSILTLNHHHEPKHTVKSCISTHSADAAASAVLGETEKAQEMMPFTNFFSLHPPRPGCDSYAFTFSMNMHKPES